MRDDTERPADEGAVTSVGSRGDGYDNALAETVRGLHKTELMRRRGTWRTTEQVELATAAWVDWWSRRRLRFLDWSYRFTVTCHLHLLSTYR